MKRSTREQLYNQFQDEKSAGERNKELFFGMLKEGELIMKGKQGEIICDIDKIKQLTTLEVEKNLGYKQRASGAIPWRTWLFEMFEDQKVYSPEDYKEFQKGEDLDPIPLFYVPEDKDSAFSPEVIADNEFYLTPCDLMRIKSAPEVEKYYEKYGYSARAADLALRIFHPEYGDGYRDDDTGELMIWDKEHKKHKKITREWIVKRSGTVIPYFKRGFTLWDKPDHALTDARYVELENYNLVSRDDFTYQVRVFAEEMFERGKQKTISKKGLVYQGGVKYSLGQRFAGHKVVGMPGRRFGILDDKGEVGHWFRLLSQNDFQALVDKRKAQGKSTKKGSLVVKKDQIRIYRADELSEQSEQDRKEAETDSPVGLFRADSIVNNMGSVCVGNLCLTLGKEFAGKEVIQLESGLFGVLEVKKGRKKLVYWCRPSSAGIVNKRRKEREERFKKGEIKEKRLVYLAKSRGDIILEPYKSAKVNKKLKGEKKDAYEKRIEALAGIEGVLEFGEAIAKEAGVGIHHLTYREQEWLSTYANSREGNYDQMIEFAQEFGLEGLKTFIATEYGMGMGDKIIDIANTVDKQAAKQIFAKYNGIVGASKQVVDFFSEFYGEDKTFSEKALNETMRSLLDRAKKFLDEYSKRVKSSGKKRRGENELSQVLEELDSIKAEILLFSATYREAAKEKSLKFNQIPDTKLTSKSASRISKAEKDQLCSFFKRARSTYDKPSIIQKDIKAFKAQMKNYPDKTQIYRLAHKGEMVAFMRFDMEKDGSIHAASLNNSPDAAKSGIGMAFLGEALKKAAEKHVIRGEVALVPFLMENYVKKFGFIINGVEVDPKDGEIIFTMVMDKELNKEVDESEVQSEMISVDLNKKTDKEWITNELKEELASGSVIREVVADPQNKKAVTIRLERVGKMAVAV